MPQDESSAREWLAEGVIDWATGIIAPPSEAEGVVVYEDIH